MKSKKARTWSSDVAHNMTDRELGKLQRRIEGVFEECRDDMERTAQEYWAKLKIRDQKMKEELKKGTITDEQYVSWYWAQVGRGSNFETLRDRLAQRVVESSSYANDIIRGTMPSMYAINRNWSAYQIETITGADFALWDEHTVKRLLVEKPDLMPHYSIIKAIDKERNLAYCKTKITDVVTSGILQGWSIDQMASELARNVSGMERSSAIRAARTATTSAENAGRLDGFAEAEGMGIEMEKEWMSTLDGRTRDSHRMLDGVHVPVKKKFPNGLEYPADPSGAPHEVYNCRCTLVAWFPELKAQNDARYTFSKWQADKEARGETIGKLDKVGYNERVAKMNAQPKITETPVATVLFGNEKPTNKYGKEIEIDDRVAQTAQELIIRLANEYDTRLQYVVVGSVKSAGSVSVGGATMHLSAMKSEVPIHEFFHTLASKYDDKIGVTHDQEFWKEAQKLYRAYNKNVGDDYTRFVSSYEHGSRKIDEFYAESFALVKMREYGIEKPKWYGDDYTWAEQAVALIDRYFKKKR